MARTCFGCVARVCVIITATFGVLRWAAGSPTDNWRALTSHVGVPTGEVGFDRLLVSITALAAWVALGWFCTVAGLAFASVAPGAVGRLCAKASRRLTPHLVRRLVEAVVGISMLAGPLSATAAFAASAPPTPAAASPAVTAPSNAAPGGSTSDLDRPTAHVAPAGRLPVFLDRPANPYVAPSPRPPAMRTPPGSAALIAGSPHRDGPGRATSGYVVRRGDALWDIAARHLGAGATAADIAREWPRWYRANRAVIGDDPAVIRPGELLVPP